MNQMKLSTSTQYEEHASVSSHVFRMRDIIIHGGSKGWGFVFGRVFNSHMVTKDPRIPDLRCEKSRANVRKIMFARGEQSGLNFVFSSHKQRPPPRSRGPNTVCRRLGFNPSHYESTATTSGLETRTDASRIEVCFFFLYCSSFLFYRLIIYD